MKRPETDTRLSHYLGPRHWPMWFGLLLFRLLELLPYRWQMRAGGLLGDLLYRLVPKRRHTARVNIDLCFPQLDAEAREALARRAVRSAGIASLELPLAWWASRKRLAKLSRIEGREHMEAALQQGKGVIMVGGHFTSMLMAGRILADNLDFNILIKRAHYDFFEALMRRHRQRHYAGLIESTDIKTMVRRLKKGEICWYSPDQDFGPEHSVFAPFMGVPTATYTGLSRLAKLSGAAVVPVNFERLPDGAGYRIAFLPAWEEFPSGDELADATRLNRFIEAHVKEVPDQYLWVHRRFKTRPAGEPNPYASH